MDPLSAADYNIKKNSRLAQGELGSTAAWVCGKIK
jgi:hypothetical protein